MHNATVQKGKNKKASPINCMIYVYSFYTVGSKRLQITIDVGRVKPWCLHYGAREKRANALYLSENFLWTDSRRDKREKMMWHNGRGRKSALISGIL